MRVLGNGRNVSNLLNGASTSTLAQIVPFLSAYVAYDRNFLSELDVGFDFKKVTPESVRKR